MQIQFSSHNFRLVLSSLAMAVVLFLAIIRGVNTGQQTARAEMVLQTANNLNSGLAYFYRDQNRYPSVVEFSDNNLMQNYFSNFPPQEFISVSCGQSFVYKRLSLTGFQLNFCLPAAFGNYPAGWNSINK